MARRHSMFEPGSRAVVAVSGGPDSLCLLHGMVRLRRLLRVEPVCFHFDHGLRKGSERDAAYVRRQARRLGVAFVLRAAESKPERGQSVEAWARVVRYEALFRAVEETGSSTAAVAHTSDDQAETVLLALVRGGGLDALAGMEPVSPPVVRPLLETSREETQAFCRALRLRPRSDPMNEDPSFLRVAIRSEMIPLLEERLGRNVRDTVARTAALLREDARLIDAMADAAGRRILRDGGALDVTGLSRTPRPVAARVVRRAILDLGVVPEAAHIEAVLGLLPARPGNRLSLPGGLIARREREYVRVLRSSPGGRRPGRRQAGRRPNGEGSNGDTD
jgi:tRNA(Ile)-lysidine synthase